MERPKSEDFILARNGHDGSIEKFDAGGFAKQLEAYADHLELQLAERDKQLAALKNELGHDRVEQAEYIAAQTDQINALNKQLAEMRESVKGIVEKVSSTRFQLTMMYDFPSKASELLDAALESARKAGLVT